MSSQPRRRHDKTGFRRKRGRPGRKTVVKDFKGLSGSDCCLESRPTTIALGIDQKTPAYQRSMIERAYDKSDVRIG